MTLEHKDSLTNMASNGDVDHMQALLIADQKSLSSETVQYLSTIAVRSSQLNIVNLLLSQYPSVPLDEEIVRAAVYTGSIPIFEALLARDPSVINMQFDRRGSPLVVACMGRQRFEYLQFLLQAGADPNPDPGVACSPLALVAAFYTDSAAIDLLLQYGARIEQSGALAAATYLGKESMIRYLLSYGARVDTDAPASKTETSPLCVAIKSGHVDVARLLLQHGADANAIDDNGVTAIEVANQMRQEGKDMTEMMEILTEKRH